MPDGSERSIGYTSQLEKEGLACILVYKEVSVWSCFRACDRSQATAGVAKGGLGYLATSIYQNQALVYIFSCQATNNHWYSGIQKICCDTRDVS